MPADSISCWEDLEATFLDNFQGTYVRPPDADDLSHIIQQPEESARQFWTRFLTKKKPNRRLSGCGGLRCFQAQHPRRVASPAPWSGKVEIYFVREKTASWLAVITYQRTMVPQIPRTTITGHVATSISAALTAKILRIRQSMPDSVALNPVSGKSHSKEATRTRPVWTAYSIARVKFTAPPIS